jgi:hypothetical protein
VPICEQGTKGTNEYRCLIERLSHQDERAGEVVCLFWGGAVGGKRKNERQGGFLMAPHRGRIGAGLLAEQNTIGAVGTSGTIGTFGGIPAADKPPEGFGIVRAATEQIRNQRVDVAGLNGKPQVNETEIQ